MSQQNLTPHEVSELFGLLLQEVGKLTLLDQTGKLTPYGRGRIEVLSSAYGKLQEAAPGYDGLTIGVVETPTSRRQALTIAIVRAELFPRLVAHLGADRSDVLDPISTTALAEITEALKRQNKINAIKALRAHANLGLKESKELVEDVQMALGLLEPEEQQRLQDHRGGRF